MAVEQRDLDAAQELFERMVNYYQSIGVRKFETSQDEQGNFHMTFGYRGEDFPMDFHFVVDPDQQLIVVLSPQPVRVPQDKVADMARAVAAMNYRLVIGQFAFDQSSGFIYWKLAVPFRGSLISEEVFDYIIHGCIHIVDEYNDKLIMLAKGMLDIDTFIESQQ